MPSWLHHAIAQSSTSICTVKCTGGEAVHTQSVLHCSAKLPGGSSSPPAVMSQLSEHPCSHPRPPSPVLPPPIIKT